MTNSAATTVGGKSVASLRLSFSLSSELYQSVIALSRDGVAPLVSRGSISRHAARATRTRLSALLSITSISFRTPGIGRGDGAGAARAIWLALLRR